MKRILVLGSLNIDLVQPVERLPAAGETLSGGDLKIFEGGKGANQACAAALLGGQVSMAGKVGSDVFAARLTGELQGAGVDTRFISTSNAPTGSAMIFVLPNGENTIVISPGANGDVSVDFALEAVATLQPGDLLLCQLEIPLATVQAALTAAHGNQVTTMLDPAPACPLPKELLGCVSILTPNQNEAAMLLKQWKVPEDFKQAAAAARQLQALGAATVIVKMGAQGFLMAEGETVTSKPGYQVHVADTTAAGDTFNGALAAALARGATMLDAAAFANAAAALSVTRPGALASIPKVAEVESFLLKNLI